MLICVNLFMFKSKECYKFLITNFTKMILNILFLISNTLTLAYCNIFTGGGKICKPVLINKMLL